MNDLPDLDAVNELLACRSCAASSFALDAAEVVCGACGARFPVRSGVVDFVAGGQSTALDTHNYDAFHRVDERIDSAFLAVRDCVGGPLSGELGTVFELGAGTGLFTAGLLRNLDVRTLVATDVSPDMLGICAERIRRTVSKETRLLYATNNAEELCAAHGKYDLVIGHFVVHHVLHYENTLRAAYGALKEGGAAVFVEPAYKFHSALFQTLSRVLERMWRAPKAWDARELDALTSLHREWYHNLKYAKHPRFLMKQEDKHFFDRRAVVERALAAGFDRAYALPYGFSDPLQSAAGVYLSQIGLSPATLHRVLDLFESEFPGPFAVLDEDDAAVSVAFVLVKAGEYTPPERGQQRRESLVESKDRNPRYDLNVTVTRAGGARHVGVDGWICATRPVISVVVSCGTQRHELPVCWKRSDVLQALSPLGAYPFEALLYSGVLGDGLAVGAEEPIAIAAVFSDADALEEHELSRRSIDSGSFRVKRL